MGSQLQGRGGNGRTEDFPPVFSAFSAGRGRAESRRVRGLQKLGGLRARCEAFRSCVAEGRLLSFVFSCRCYQHKVRRLTGRAPVPFIFHPLHKEGIGLSSTLLQRLWQCRAPRSSPPQVRECGEARSGLARRRSDGVPREPAEEAGLSRRGYRRGAHGRRFWDGGGCAHHQDRKSVV